MSQLPPFNARAHLDGRSGIVASMAGLGSGLRPLSVSARLVRPLSLAEVGEAERVASRVHAEFRRLISRLPEHAQHASGMSRHLGVLRATCQRVVQSIQDPTPTVQLLTTLPGIEGLGQFLEGARRAGADPADVDLAQSAMEAFERLITTTGGSLTKLVERLQAGGLARTGSADASGVATPEQREALFHAAVGVTGRCCDVALSIYAFRPSQDEPNVLERALAKGVIGGAVVPGGMPMVLSSGDTLKDEDEVRNITLLNNEAASGRTPEALLRPFSTDPLPTVTARGKGGKLFQIIDPQIAAGEAPEQFDVVTAVRGRHPLVDPETGRPSLDAVWSLVTCPTARLILDVYLHASMERQFRPAIDGLLWTPDLNIPEEQKWVMRVPSQPKLQLLGRGIGNAASDFYPRHAELTRYFYDHIGWNPEDFLGFRCEVLFPVWRAGYCMGMEYLGGPAAPEVTPP